MHMSLTTWWRKFFFFIVCIVLATAVSLCCNVALQYGITGKLGNNCAALSGSVPLSELILASVHASIAS